MGLDLLKAAAAVSPPSKGTEKAELTSPEAIKSAKKVVALTVEVKELTAQLDTEKDRLKACAGPIQDEQDRARTGVKTVAVPVGDHEVQITSRNYTAVDAVVPGTKTKAPVDNERELRDALGEQFEALILRQRTVAVKREVANNDEALSEMLTKLEKAFGKGAADFVGRYLEVREQLVPRPGFESAKHTLSGDQQEIVDGLFRRVVAVTVR